jgi:hypothetical protein
MRDDGFWSVAKGYGRNFFTNWRVYDAPFLTKLWLTFRNGSRALFSTRQCCGNHGQPGC